MLSAKTTKNSTAEQAQSDALYLRAQCKKAKVNLDLWQAFFQSDSTLESVINDFNRAVTIYYPVSEHINPADNKNEWCKLQDSRDTIPRYFYLSADDLMKNNSGLKAYFKVQLTVEQLHQFVDDVASNHVSIKQGIAAQHIVSFVEGASETANPYFESYASTQSVARAFSEATV